MMLVGMSLFTFNDAIGKWLTADFSVGQLLAVRSLFALLMVAPLVLRAGVRSVFTVHLPLLHLVRIACMSADVACFYSAVRWLPLADVMTIYMASPLFVTALSVPLLHEKVGWRRWLAVSVGFVGVLLVLNPMGTVTLVPSLLALTGSLVFSLGMVATRSLRDSGGLRLITFQMAGGVVAGAVTLPWTWVAPAGGEFALVAMLGGVAMLGHVAMNKSLQLSRAATVVPFQYVSIVWAVVLGILVWGDIPSTRAGLGAILIIGSGLFVFFREQTLAAATKTASSP